MQTADAQKSFQNKPWVIQPLLAGITLRLRTMLLRVRDRVASTIASLAFDQLSVIRTTSTN